jgi:hypothetical protein
MILLHIPAILENAMQSVWAGTRRFTLKWNIVKKHIETSDAMNIIVNNMLIV